MVTYHRLNLALLFPVALFILNGCLPIPHHARLAPPITGVVQDGDMPLSNVSVYLDATSRDENCFKYDLVAETNRKGEFKIGPVQVFRWIAFIYGDPVANWRLCVDTENGRKTILRQGGIGMPPWNLDIQCDVSKNEISYIEAFGTIEGKCRKR